jgi:hypothetical protein
MWACVQNSCSTDVMYSVKHDMVSKNLILLLGTCKIQYNIAVGIVIVILYVRRSTICC